MKRVILNFPFFIVTLMMGLLLPPELAREISDAVAPTQTTFRYIPWSYANSAGSDDFVPEFRDLPNFDEIDYPESSDDLIDIFQIGNVYRESDVIAKTGESWLTLFEHNGSYSFKPARAKVRHLKTASYAGDELDVRLTFDKPGVPMLAVRNLKTLRPGKVTTLYSRPSSEEIDRRNLPIGAMEDGYKQDFDLNETWYTLRVSKGVAKDGTKLGLLVLENETERQVIYSTEYFSGEKIIIGYLFWVGDLDNDGKLDIYLDTYNEKGGSGANLYVSSEAEQGKLVKLVAMFGVPGC